MCQWNFAMFEWRILLLSVECWHRTGAKTTEQGEGARTTAHGTRGEAGTVWGGDTAGHHGHRGDIRLRIQCSEGKGSNSVEEFQHFVTGVCVKSVGWIQHFVTVVCVKRVGLIQHFVKDVCVKRMGGIQHFVTGVWVKSEGWIQKE